MKQKMNTLSALEWLILWARDAANPEDVYLLEKIRLLMNLRDQIEKGPAHADFGPSMRHVDLYALDLK